MFFRLWAILLFSLLTANIVSSRRPSTRKTRVKSTHLSHQTNGLKFTKEMHVAHLPHYKLPELNAKQAKRLIKKAKRMVPFAGASYCKSYFLEDLSCRYCRTLKKSHAKVKLLGDIESSSGTRAVVFDDPDKREIIVAFRGSENVKKVIMAGSTNNSPYKGHKKFYVHDKTQQLFHSIMADLKPLLKEAFLKRPDYNLTLTGHSLGGSFSTLAAPILQKRLNIAHSRIGVVTFGQPRVGDEHFAKWFNKLPFRYYLRVVNNKDLVPHSPFRSYAWAHVQREIFIKDGVTKIGSIDELEDGTCSLKESNFNLFSYLREHADYWGRKITSDAC